MILNISNESNHFVSQALDFEVVSEAHKHGHCADLHELSIHHIKGFSVWFCLFGVCFKLNVFLKKN